MSKVLSDTERKRRKLRNIYNSLEKRLNPNDLVWWNSLSMKAQYSLVFRWIEYKNSFKLKNKKEPKIKYFIESYRTKYKPKLNMYRNSIIEHIIGEK